MKNLWSGGGKIMLILGLSLLGLYVVLGSFLSFIGGLLALLINGVVWTTLGCVFLYIARVNAAKYLRLKQEGICYDAEIIQIIPNGIVRVNTYVSARAECSYINQESKTCLVRSNIFMMTLGRNDYTAKVYVNRNDPRDYVVELIDGSVKNVQADYDYR